MKLQFDVAGIDLQSVRNYSYKYFLDGNTVGTALAGVTVEEHDGYFTATVPVPSEAVASPSVTVNGVLVPAKTHTLEISVSDSNGESVKSSKLTVDAAAVLPAPMNLRLHGKFVVPPVAVAKV